nr:T-cell-interacting, activating receptor on myeloid cells protein 1-like isoform X2 [Pogona vitticeps]
MVLIHRAEWPIHMRWPFHALFLGWWLTGQLGVSGGQFWPKPSISVSPCAMVPVGENATIRCKCEERYLPAEFTLSKTESGSLRVVSTKTVERDEAVFHIINAKPSDAGTYRCIFRLEHRPLHLSRYSDKVHIETKDDSQLNHGSFYFPSVEVWIRLGVGIVAILALVLILAEATYSWRTEQHFRNMD